MACDVCGGDVRDEVYLDGDFGEEVVHCPACADREVGRLAAAARKYAAEHCRLTGPLLTPDGHPLTADDLGETRRERERTWAHLRHNCTNYERLIAPFPRDSRRWEDTIHYLAVLGRTMELVEEAVECLPEPPDEEGPCQVFATSVA